MFDERGEIDRTPLVTKLELEGVADTALKFPGKVLAPSDRLFISDSNHHQVVVATLDGREIERIGSGQRETDDGSFAEAEFHKPQGLAIVDVRLWVADTENRLLRAVDLVASCLIRSRHGPVLFIAMAGAHQIWMMDVARGIVWRYAGSGYEARIDGPIKGAEFKAHDWWRADVRR